MKVVVASSTLAVASLLPLSSYGWSTTTASSRRISFSSRISSVAGGVIYDPSNPISLLESSSTSSLSTVSDLKMSFDLRMRQQQLQKQKQHSSPRPPSMFLGDQLFSSPSTILSSSPYIERVQKQRSLGSDIDPSSSQKQQHQQRGVLGFDVFELEAHSTRSNASPSQVDMKTWDSNNSQQEGGTFFPAPSGWNSYTAAPFLETSSTVSFSRGASSLSSSKFVPTRTATLAPERLPWIPTKEQIQSLKVTELKEACGQRSLIKVSESFRSLCCCDQEIVGGLLMMTVSTYTCFSLSFNLYRLETRQTCKAGYGRGSPRNTNKTMKDFRMVTF